MSHHDRESEKEPVTGRPPDLIAGASTEEGRRINWRTASPAEHAANHAREDLPQGPPTARRARRLLTQGARRPRTSTKKRVDRCLVVGTGQAGPDLDDHAGRSPAVRSPPTAAAAGPHGALERAPGAERDGDETTRLRGAARAGRCCHRGAGLARWCWCWCSSAPDGPANRAARVGRCPPDKSGGFTRPQGARPGRRGSASKKVRLGCVSRSLTGGAGSA